MIHQNENAEINDPDWDKMAEFIHANTMNNENIQHVDETSTTTLGERRVVEPAIREPRRFAEKSFPVQKGSTSTTNEGISQVRKEIDSILLELEEIRNARQKLQSKLTDLNH